MKDFNYFMDNKVMGNKAIGFNDYNITLYKNGRLQAFALG